MHASVPMYQGDALKIFESTVLRKFESNSNLIYVISYAFKNCWKYQLCTYMYMHNYSGTSLKWHNTFNLSIKDKFCDPYRIMANTILSFKEGNIRITIQYVYCTKLAVPKAFIVWWTWTCCDLGNMRLLIWLITGLGVSGGYLSPMPTLTTPCHPTSHPPTHFMCNLWSFLSWKKPTQKPANLTGC